MRSLRDSSEDIVKKFQNAVASLLAKISGTAPHRQTVSVKLSNDCNLKFYPTKISAKRSLEKNQWCVEFKG
jgi:hypothetical protein